MLGNRPGVKVSEADHDNAIYPTLVQLGSVLGGAATGHQAHQVVSSLENSKGTSLLTYDESKQ